MSRQRKKTRRESVERRSPGRPLLTGACLFAIALAGSAWALWLSSGTDARETQSAVRILRSLRVSVLRTIPHETSAYTQGLVWHDSHLYESTGQYGESRLRQIDPRTGVVDQQISISPAFFGEGLALVGDNELFMLTYQAERGMVYDLETFDQIRTFRYRGEGWGLCYDGRRLIMSNGSDTLTFRDPSTFKEIGAVRVTLRGLPLTKLNELECVSDRVYSNVYQDDAIVIIDPSSGRVTHQIDASGLLTPEETRGTDVLNGIAYDPNTETFYITGKNWPKMFEVQFVG